MNIFMLFSPKFRSDSFGESSSSGITARFDLLRQPGRPGPSFAGVVAVSVLKFNVCRS